MKHNSGMALITALIFISITVIVMTSLAARHVQQRIQVDWFEDYYDAFNGAEAGMTASEVAIDLGSPTNIGLEDWTPVFDDDGTLQLPSFDDPNVAPEVLASMPDVEYMSFVINWENDGRDNNGDGIADDAGEAGMFTIYSAGRKESTTRSIESVYGSSNVNVWQNAIFAGNGQAGGLINGNVSIAGSVHLLGQDLPLGGLAINAIDLSGTSLIHNTYDGMSAYMAARVPPLLRTFYEGEDMGTLRTNLRVKNGRVAMSGNSKIGLDHVAGSGLKYPVDGTFVNTGWAGNSVINDGGRGIPTNVRSDNGWDELYDLGNRVSLPLLLDDWREPNGDRVMNPSTGTWYTHDDYFTQVLLAAPDVTNDGIFSGNMTLNARSNQAYYWNATTQQQLTGAAALTAPRNPDHDYVVLDPANDVLYINGQIRINGNLTFTGQGNDTTINYSGRGAFLVDGHVQIDANLLTCNNGNKNDYTNSFPVRNIMGVMSTQTMLVGSTSQLDIMGAFYAQQSITSRKQTNIAGTFVSNYFDMGTNVPRIYQVPALADNLPYGMIGNFPLLILQQVSWRELGL